MALSRLLARRNSLLGAPGSSSYQSLYNSYIGRGFEHGRNVLAPSSVLNYTSAATSGSPGANTGSGEDDRSQIAVQSSSTPARRRGRSRRGSLWRSPWDLVPFGGGHRGFENAIANMSGSLSKLFENLVPSSILGRVKEDDNCYKLRYEVPGLAKEDIKITVENGFLTIAGEHKEEEEEESEDEGGWQASGYRFYHTTFMLPADAKAGDIKAELKHGVLHITIPRSEEKKSDAKQIEIQ